MFSKKLILAVCAIFCSLSAWSQQQNLLIYCGITQVRPITELARLFEAKENVRIQIAQGGSEDLYQSAKKSRLGDLYLPGEPSYREKHLAEGLFGEHKVVGYNQMAIIVQKGNPKRVKGNLNELLRKDLTIMIGNAESGSVGQETRTMLEMAALYPKVVAKAVELMPDSRAINLAMKRGEADATLNWRATSFFPDNATHLEAVDLDAKIAKPQALLLIQLTFSKNPLLARKFVDFVASEEGQAVFRKNGFLDNKSVK
ncbi:substrate-binding domain-containing protein [Propionivibrio sp.]|uniref:substrate-binding domain-containing protein n=1 Tax=Propionivibrio sp. TaxID=2212460 RepID=UPI003BF075F1